MALNPESIKSKAGLVLTGGGARAAYQVGVLKAVRELLPRPEKNPFPIVCGTSAGAINAATLAVFADNFDAAVGRLLEVWESFRVHRVYRSDPLGIARVGLRWLAAVTLVSRTSPVSLLDNSPLADMLSRSLDFGRIQENIDNGHLYASTTTTVYRWPYAGDRKPLGDPQTVVTGMPTGGHVTRTLQFDTQGRMYVSIGSGSNVVVGDNGRVARHVSVPLRCRVVVGKVRELKADEGFNALTEKYENLVEAGVIDPTKVVRSALQNAASIASLLLTTEATICEIADDKTDGGMGGMPQGGGGMY